MDEKIFNQISYGLYVLTAAFDGKDNGCIVNTFMQAASDPLTVCICVNKENYTCEMIQKSGRFTVSLLSMDTTFETIKHFGFQSGKDVNKFADFTDCIRLPDGSLAVIKETNSYIYVCVKQQIDLGSHIMFIGTPAGGEKLSDVPSLTYAYYFEHVKPKPQAVGTTTDGLTIWRCSVCGYEYVGEELPENFICPTCKHSAAYFEKVIK